VSQGVHILIKIPAFAGMTGSAGAATSAVMAVRAGVVPEKGSSSGWRILCFKSEHFGMEPI
nr:hypothetical protein [Candidatus Hydrogenedentota bacterium]